MPTAEQQQQKNKPVEPRIKIDHAASPMPETRQPERLAPRATSNRNGGRDHLGILGEIKSVHPGEIVGIRTRLPCVELLWMVISDRSARSLEADSESTRRARSAAVLRRRGKYGAWFHLRHPGSGLPQSQRRAPMAAIPDLIPAYEAAGVSEPKRFDA